MLRDIFKPEILNDLNDRDLNDRKTAPKHLFIFLMKLLSCLSHCFRSSIVGFYQQWAFVILHNLDPD